ncbi:MAG: hypothetical protein OES46_09310 [Gammaproteobacteria bacterium]|nr:hypothetical protein [Gammaproteobacteria bacterium]
MKANTIPHYLSRYTIVGLMLLTMVGIVAMREMHMAMELAEAEGGAQAAGVLAETVKKLVAIYSAAGLVLLVGMWWFCVRQIARPLAQLTAQLQTVQQEAHTPSHGLRLQYDGSVKELRDLTLTLERYRETVTRRLLRSKAGRIRASWLRSVPLG